MKFGQPFLSSYQEREALWWVSLRLMKPASDEFGCQIVYVDYSTAMIKTQKLNQTERLPIQQYRNNLKTVQQIRDNLDGRMLQDNSLNGRFLYYSVAEYAVHLPISAHVGSLTESISNGTHWNSKLVLGIYTS